MRNRLPFLSGLALAALGVSGLAGGGLLWNFQGRTLGLGSTVTALVLLGISFVLLRPEPRLSPVEIPEASQPLKFKAPQASFLGLVNRTFRGVAYVSFWVVIWGTVASLMDWMLLTGEVYETASSGQAVTFIAYGAATVVLATRFSGRFLADADSEAADQE